MASFESSFEFNYHQNNIGAYVNDIGGFSKKQTKYSIHQSFSSVYLYLWLNSNAVYLFMLFCITSVSIYKQLCTKAPCRTKLFVEFFASFIKCFRISLIFVTPARNRKKTPMFTMCTGRCHAFERVRKRNFENCSKTNVQFLSTRIV